MPRPRREADAALQRLYDQIPAIPDCQGKCWVSCGPIDMADRERQKIRQAGYRITDPETARRDPGTFWCDALTAGGRCAVYAIRPLICRLWGTTRSLACPFGCQPERWLDEAEGFRLLILSMTAGGAHGQQPPAAKIDAVVAELMRFAPARIREAADTGMAARIHELTGPAGLELPPEITSRRARR